MNFFEHQDIARRNSRLLVGLFLLLVFVLIVITNLLVAGLLWFGDDYNVYAGSAGVSGFLSHLSWARFGTIGLGISATITLVVLVKWWQLSTGGKVVAESMGGTRILPQTSSAVERRCLNVVEELSLAANMPVPAVYVLRDERGINAFAAGLSPADAVVAVTQGTLEHLKRSELEGVIAHEFSHILHGDMRLNIRLAAMLKGITFVGDVGQLILRSGMHRRLGSSKNKDSGPPLMVVGLGLLVIGWCGGMVAGFLKAAVGRQKEYLADASAVQFTRNPDSIADALKVIGGYVPGTLVHAARAVEMSHIFFGQITHSLWQVFATHPPLDARIRRLDPGWNGQFIERKVEHYKSPQPAPADATQDLLKTATVTATVLAASAALGTPTSSPQTPAAAAGTAPMPSEPAAAKTDVEDTDRDLEQQTAVNNHLPMALVAQSREPLGANALVFALLLSREPDHAQVQLTLVRDSGVLGLEELVFTLAPAVHALPAPKRLPLLELCLPSLKAVSLPQYRVFKNTLLAIVRADKNTELYEWCMFQLVRHYLDPEFVKVKASRPRYRNLQKVAYHLRVALSVLAHEGSGSSEQVFNLATDELGLKELHILPRDQCNVALFSKAVHALADCYPLIKPAVLKAMAMAAGADGLLSGTEREIIASMAAVMDAPLPRALDADFAEEIIYS